MAKTPEKHKVVVHLKGGGSFSIVADSIVAKRSPVNGQLQSLSWEQAVAAPLFIDLDQVAAVTVVY